MDAPRTRACAYCGLPVTARKPTGRPPRYCPAEQRDCQARARAERITARAAGMTGGPGALRETVLELAGQLDEVWEPLQDLVGVVQGSRDLLGAVRDELIARAEQAERAAEEAHTARQQAEDRARVAEAARDEALHQAQEARTQRTEALRARDAADRARQDSLLAQERLRAERDAAREQADKAKTDASAAVAQAEAVADARVREAVESTARAREAAAVLRGELATARERLDERATRVRDLEAEVDRVRDRLAVDLARITAEITADADGRVERAHAENRAQDARSREDLHRLGVQTERADRFERAHARLLDRVAGVLREATAPAEEHDAGRERKALDTLAALLSVETT
ncbi:hypothetical protein GCM10022243_56960 [Saccharothrix violaceirubra]|uniref:Chromosome segregation ATPase n=1 Tax=Saccharothrix violaceirubra TaxID=413306 RepID=A0A7W7T3E6_9PSEU|nr:hypothetical protein [Saccharothrix violaceirubra]MBB4965872.1 chromosome segregation ATPase [Saccharothrix violaceirubra]